MSPTASPTVHLKNGDQLIINTDPPILATVIGIFDDGYGILWSESGTVADAEVRKLPFKLYREGREQGLISLPGEPSPLKAAAAARPEPKPKKRKKAEAAPPAARMPWAK